MYVPYAKGGAVRTVMKRLGDGPGVFCASRRLLCCAVINCGIELEQCITQKQRGCTRSAAQRAPIVPSTA